MTVLQALAARYERQAQAGQAPVPGFAPAQVSFTIVIGRDGSYVTTEDERVGDGKKVRPRVILAPAPPKRTVAIASGAFWDKTSYVLGATAVDLAVSAAKQARDAERLVKEHAAFRARHETMLSETSDEGCLALLAFLRGWSPDRFDTLRHASEMLDQSVAFRLDGDRGFLHERAAARSALLAETAGTVAAAEAICLVTGTSAPVARLHPSIKGVPGAQSAGAALVSFNLEAFTSYGHVQGANAPVSEAAAFAYTTALNGLLAPSGSDAAGKPRFANRVRFGDITTAFWAEHGSAETLIREMLGGREEEEEEGPDGVPAVSERTEAVKLRDVMGRLKDGVPLEEAGAGAGIDPGTRTYVLGLSPNAARLSVRFWIEQELVALARHFQQHWLDLEIQPRPPFWPPPAWALLRELAPRRKLEDISPHLGGEVMRAIINGTPYPRALLAQTVMRIRADRDQTDVRSGRTLEKVSALRVAILKACLARMYRNGQIREDVPVSEDPRASNVAYQLGRLFAVLERLQGAALGQRNATVRDRFYASASATPALVFPSLIRNARNHSKTVRMKASAGLAEWFENQIGDTLPNSIESFPRTLPLEEQGRFALGYYHRREAFRRKKDTPPELEAATADDPATADEG